MVEETAGKPVTAVVPPGGREWLEAAKTGDLQQMEILLAENAELLSYRGKGCSLGFIGHSALHWAAAKGHMTVLSWLLREGADISLVNNAGSTALHTAAQNGQQAATEALLSAGADPAAQDADGYTARDVAASRGHGSVARVLEAATGKSALRGILAGLAAQGGGWKVGQMKEALRLGRISCEGVTEKSELESMVRELMEGEILDAHSPGKVDAACVSNAEATADSQGDSSKPYSSVARAPVEPAASAPVRNMPPSHPTNTPSALDDLTDDESDEVTDRVLAAQAKLRAMKAARQGTAAVAAEAESRQSNIYSQDMVKGGTSKTQPPVPRGGREWLEAAKRGDVAALERLLAENAELLSYRGKGCSLGFIGHSALHWAAAKGHMTVLSWLLREGADISLVNNAGSTALHTAAQNGQQAATEALLSAGADPAAQDADGYTARDVAASRGHGSVARVLEAATGKSALRGILAGLAAQGGGWKVGQMKEALRLGRISCEGVTEKSELESMVRELLEREESVCTAVGGTPSSPDAKVVKTSTDGSIPQPPVSANSEAPSSGAASEPSTFPNSSSLQMPAQNAQGGGQSDDEDMPESTHLKEAAERSKAKGNASFASGDLEAAVKHFTVAIRLDPSNHILFSNRSAAHASAGAATEALADAERCVQLAPGWAKGYSRQAAAYVILGRYREANRAYRTGLEIEPDNEGLRQGLDSLRTMLRHGDVTSEPKATSDASNHANNRMSSANVDAPPTTTAATTSSSVSPTTAGAAGRRPSGGNVGTRWIEAAKVGQIDVMRSILKEGGNDLVHHKARGIGHTALHWAAARGEVRVMEWLLSVGATVDALNASDATALHAAAANGQAYAVEFLLQNGADPSLRNDDGKTAADVAASKGRPDLASKILEARKGIGG